MRAIRSLRVARGLTQKAVAEKLGMQDSQYNGIELIEDKLDALAKVLQVKSIKIVIEK